MIFDIAVISFIFICTQVIEMLKSSYLDSENTSGENRKTLKVARRSS